MSEVIHLALAMLLAPAQDVAALVVADPLQQDIVAIGRKVKTWRAAINSGRGHVAAVGAKGGLIRRLLVDHPAALRAKATPAVTIKDTLLV